ncbi:leucyl aminopeptidase [Cocleimonas sp. KMM 6892]|uniref:leucyl aminopeptidase n=1 Tax=unclassified Cocleimonas TaxID=2639732 RepID=UPI002DB57E46|nr:MULTISPECIES: leucyl aminopeptidase [unclassified Cocleimonas]MEB8433947.1 leucyl aminopeptidase [Cocleimonas sp. KMM 6892]MEC4716758.1 leucyl aminopeptidase [Cocleimonas sp. KMM 6895]MEC4746087.1 leucyl aminopeptidase [Cocleimonas sp. KMM 6896]
MQYTINNSDSPANNQDDCIVLPVFSADESAELHLAAKKVDIACSGKISKFIDTGDFKGTLEETHIFYALDGVKAARVMLVGCGDKDKFDTASLNKATKAAAKALKSSTLSSVSLYLADAFKAKEVQNAVTQIIIAYADNEYQLLDYKSEKKDPSKLDKVSIAFTKPSDKLSEKAELGIQHGASIAKGMKLSRDLANHPGNVCTPTYIADEAKAVAKDYSSISIEILEEADMEKLGMGSFLSVSKGSDQPGKMIVLEYKGAKDKKQAPIALVGKGITFDTGGISLKPGANMDEMKFDMCGAAGMLGTLKACAEMKLPLNVVVVLAAAENMPSGRASKPGDIVTSMAGKTIEVLNTDAEGRLVLCDALTYVGKYKPEVVIDAATLTGACIVALGHHICAVLSNDDDLAGDIIDAGNSINDRAWQLPMGEDYKKQLKSSFADLGNIGGPPAGTITAACFLAEFTKDYKWAHLDIAGTAWSGKDSTGRPVPLLSQYLINRAFN